jgi:hypothetical protein
MRDTLAWARVFRRSRLFRFEGRTFVCFAHPYNGTLNNERAVEVPIAMSFVRAHAGKAILEVGNVLSHYFSFEHDVVDKYEQAPGVMNQDIVGFQPAKRYDLIVSISTLEHVGWDEEPKDPDKAEVAFRHIRSLLAPGGKMIVTFALAYHPSLDAHLRAGTLPVDALHCYRRVSASPRWVEQSLDALGDVKYGEPHPFGNGVAICTVSADGV